MTESGPAAGALRTELFDADAQWAFFVRKMRTLAGVDLESYKPEQMRRRLNALMTRMGAGDWFAFSRLLEGDSAKLKEFKDFFTINVSEFFRGADKFLFLQDRVFPELAERRRRIRIWSAGCSVGAEPYTLAMIADKLGLAARAEILATDIDATVVDRARQGDGYADAEVREVPADYLGRYLTKTAKGWEVAPQIKAAVRFKQHNLLKDPYPAPVELIVCRNVVIYFTDQAKSEIYSGFYNALIPGGFLFVGGTEIIPRAREIGFENPQVYFYRRPSQSKPEGGG